MKGLVLSLALSAIMLFIYSCGDVPSKKIADNSTDGTVFMTFDFGNVKTGMIKVAKVRYTGRTTVMNIEPTYDDATMLANGVVPNIMTTCGDDNDTTRTISLTDGCDMYYSFSPDAVKSYSFIIPTDKGDIVFKGAGVSTTTTIPKITLGKTNYTLKTLGSGANTLYYDNITISQTSGNIDLSYAFANTNIDPYTALVFPAPGTLIDSLAPLGIVKSEFCLLDETTRKITSTSSSCKVFMLFIVNDDTLATGEYSFTIGFLADNETVANGAKITVNYTAPSE